MEVYLEGIALLRLVLSNKGTAFTEDERVALGLDGLLPPQVNTLEQQVERVYRGFLREPDPIAKYQYLRALQERAETLFYALLERASRRNDADYLHPDRGSGGAAVQPPVPESARAVVFAAQHRPRRPGGPQLPVERRADDRRHRFLGHPRHRRPGLRRAGHRHRQAGDLHHRRRRQPLPHHASEAGCGHRPAGIAQRRVLSRRAPAAAARRALFGVSGQVRQGDPRALAARGDPVGRPVQGCRVSRSWSATASRFPPSTTTFRAPARWRWPA